MRAAVSDDPMVTRSILLRSLKGNGPAREIAWGKFHFLYAPVIGAFARRMGARRGDIDDVVQDVLIGFYAASPEFTYDPARGRFRGYLKTCTWRKLQQRAGQQLQVSGRPLDMVDSEELAVDAVWEDIWETQKLHQAINMLLEKSSARPDQLKTFQAFEMAFMLQRSTDEIAAELGMSLDSVYQAKTRMIKALRAIMDDLAAFSD